MKRLYFVCAFLAGAVGVSGVARAVDPPQTFTSVIVNTQSPLDNGCIKDDNVIMSLASSSAGATIVAIDASLTFCNGLDLVAFNDVEAINVPIPLSAIKFNANSVHIAATLPAFQNGLPGPAETTLTIDATVSDQPVANPRLHVWSGTATGSIGRFNLSNVPQWTGFPLNNEQVYAAATIQRNGANSHGTGGPPSVLWPPVWLRPAGVGESQGACGVTSSGIPVYATFVSWTSGRTTLRLDGLYMQTDADCAGPSIFAFGRIDSANPSDTLVIAVQPGSRLFLDPAALAALGLQALTGTGAGSGGGGSDVCSTSFGPADYIVTGSTISPASCPG